MVTVLTSSMIPPWTRNSKHTREGTESNWWKKSPTSTLNRVTEKRPKLMWCIQNAGWWTQRRSHPIHSQRVCIYQVRRQIKRVREVHSDLEESSLIFERAQAGVDLWRCSEVETVVVVIKYQMMYVAHASQVSLQKEIVKLMHDTRLSICQSNLQTRSRRKADTDLLN